jgi:hypothetical protein
MLYENAAHGLGSNGEEVCAALPVYIVLIYQAQIGLVDECGGLKCVAEPFAAEIARGAAV